MRPQFRFKQRPVEPVSKFIEPLKSTGAYTKREKSFIAFKNYIWRYKIRFLICMIAFLLLFRYLYQVTNSYMSEVIISFSGYELPEYSSDGDKLIPEFANMKEGMNRLYNMVYSKEMYDHLIKKFNLYSHYNLDPEKPSSYVTIRKILKHSITIFQSYSRTLSIRVSDHTSAVMSANIANEIAVKASEMNKKYIKDNIENRIQVYTRLYDEIKARMDDDVQNIQPGIASLKEIVNKVDAKDLEMQKVLYSLSDVTQKIQRDVDQLLQITKVNSWSLNLMKDDVVSSVHVIQDALPGEEDDYLPRWLLFSLAIAASFFLTIILFNIVFTYQNYLRLLLK